MPRFMRGAAAWGGGSPSPYRPTGLPDHYAGASDQETIDKLFGVVNGFRQKQGDASAVPTNGDGYSFELSDVLKPYVDHFDKDRSTRLCAISRTGPASPTSRSKPPCPACSSSSEDAIRAMAPAKRQVLVAPANADLPNGICKAIEIIAADDVETLAEGDATPVTRAAVAAGTVIKVRMKQVRTGTTATVVAYY